MDPCRAEVGLQPRTLPVGLRVDTGFIVLVMSALDDSCIAPLRYILVSGRLFTWVFVSSLRADRTPFQGCSSNNPDADYAMAAPAHSCGPSGLLLYLPSIIAAQRRVDCHYSRPSAAE